jgi:RHS repeat-associated protein
MPQLTGSFGSIGKIGRLQAGRWQRVIAGLGIAFFVGAGALAAPDSEDEHFGKTVCASVTEDCNVRIGCSDCLPSNVSGCRSDGPIMLDGYESGTSGKDMSDPVRLSNGDFILSETDLVIPGIGMDFRFTRTYHSRSGYDDRTWRSASENRDTNPNNNVLPGPRSRLGRNWHHSLDMYVTYAHAGAGFVGYYFHDSDGQVDFFQLRNLGGNFTAYANPLAARRLDVHPTTGTPSLTAGDGTIYIFGGLAGRVSQVVDRNNNVMSFDYGFVNFQPVLETVTDTTGREIQFTYLEWPSTSPTAVLLESVTDSVSGKSVTYTYYDHSETGGNFGDLKSAMIDPVDGPTRTWTYTYYTDGVHTNETNLKTVTDPRGTTILTNYYDTYVPASSAQPSLMYDTIVGQDYVGERYDYRYFAAVSGSNRQTVVLNRNGQVRIASHAGDRVDARRDYTGLVAPEDRDEFLDGLDALRDTDKYISYWTVLDTYIKANVDAKLRSTDPDRYDVTHIYGSPFDGWDPSQIVQSTLEDGTGVTFEYNDGYAVPTTNGQLHGRTQNGYSSDEPAGYRGTSSATSSPPIEEAWEYNGTFGGNPGCGCSDGFATAYIDARNTRTEYEYDDYGNRTLVKSGANQADSPTNRVWLSEESFQYYNSVTIGSSYFNEPNAPLGKLHIHEHATNNAAGTQRQVDVYTYYPMNDSETARRGKLYQMVIDPTGANLVTEYDQYDDYGNACRITEKAPDGSSGFTVTKVTERTYNGHGWMTMERVRDSATGTIRSERAYTYDANGNLVRVDVSNRDSTGTVISSNDDWTTLSDYDSLDRLTWTARETIAYDSTISGTTTAEDLSTNASFICTEYQYDPNGNLALIRKGEAASESGLQPFNTVSRIYDERNLLFRETIADGSADETTTQFDYDKRKNLAKRTDALGTAEQRETLYWHDGLNRLLQSQIQDSGTATQNLVVKTIHGQFYDENGNRTASWSKGNIGSGTVVNYLAYSAMVFDRLDREVESQRFTFAPTTNLTTVQNSSHVDSERAYFADSSVKSVTDPNGNEILYAYDSASRPTLLTREDGSTNGYAYDSDSRQRTITETEFSDLDPAPSGTPQVFTTVIETDSVGRTKLVTDGRGNATAYEYDSRSNVTKSIDARGNESVYQYDGLSRLTRTIRVMCSGGEDCAASGSTPDSDDIVTEQVWDCSSRLVAQIDDNGNRTSYWYDDLDRLTLTRMADGTIHQVGNDYVTWVDFEDPPTFYSGWESGYDRRGNAVHLIDANGSVVTNSYDKANRLIARDVVTGPGGDFPVVGSDTPIPGVGNRSGADETYTYDGLSRILTALDEDTRVTRIYDSLSRLTSEKSEIATWVALGSIWQNWTTERGPKTVAYTYDDAGNVKKITYPGSSSRDVFHEYDALNRLTMIHDGDDASDPVLAEYDYAGPARVARRTHANDTRIDYTWTGHSGSSGAGFKQVTNTLSRRISDPGVIDERSYAWDPAQNKVAITGIDPVAAGPDREFAYDAASRMIESQYDGVMDPTGYILDGVHNRVEVTGAIDAGAQIGAYELEPDAPLADYPVNQYTGTPSDRPLYDENGNLTALLAQAGNSLLMSLGLIEGGEALEESIQEDVNAGGSWTDVTSDGVTDATDIDVIEQMLMEGGGGCEGEFCPLPRVVEIDYDYRNQMVRYTDVDADRVHHYHYDCFGRRVAKVTDVDSTGYYPVVTRYVYGGQASWQVLAEYSGFQPGSTTAPLATYVFGNYIDEPICVRTQIDLVSSPMEDAYYHQDELFNVVAITSGQDDTGTPNQTGEFDEGDVIERYRYGDYGNVEIVDESGSALAYSSAGNRFAFTGREYDLETRLAYYRTRYMKTEWGRFTTRDTIGIWSDESNVGSATTYVAVSPAFSIDPFGDKTFRVQRQLNLRGRKWLEPRSHLITHMFLYTTCNGKVVHTYSWGNDFDDNTNHWYLDASEDLNAARMDNARRNAMALTGCGKAPDGHELSGGDELDRHIDETFRDFQEQVFSPSRHPWRASDNCNHKAHGLWLEAQRRLRAERRQREQQERFWRQYGPILIPGILL